MTVPKIAASRFFIVPSTLNRTLSVVKVSCESAEITESFLDSVRTRSKQKLDPIRPNHAVKRQTLKRPEVDRHIVTCN